MLNFAVLGRVSTWKWAAATVLVVGGIAFFFVPAFTLRDSHADGALSATAGAPLSAARDALVQRSTETANNVRPALKVQAPGAAAAAPSGAEGNVARDRASAALRRREIVHTASISLLVNDVERTIARARAIAHAQLGDIDSLDDQRPDSPSDRHRADLKLSVPADRFEATLDRLATLGGVRSRSVGAEDVGDQLVDDRARLRNLRRTETDLLAIMDRSGKISDVLDVENELSSVRDQIEKLDAERASLEQRVAYSQIELVLEAPAAVPGAEPGTSSQVREAWSAALRELRDFTVTFVARIFVLVVFAPYWLSLALVLGFAVALGRRRLARRV